MIRLSSSIKDEKARMRLRIWSLLEEKEIARFPRPVYGRIPNFEGSEDASERLTSLPEFSKAACVKVNPDSPQRMVRYHVLNHSKSLIVPTPRIKKGFSLVDPIFLDKASKSYASGIAGSLRYGKMVSLGEIPKIDLVVLGSVAVSENGGRLGKGEGYGELEYAILKQVGAVDGAVPIITTVHDMQVVDDDLPQEEYDLPVDIIVTPSAIIRTKTTIKRPEGIDWSRLTKEKINEIPLLKALWESLGGVQ